MGWVPVWWIPATAGGGIAVVVLSYLLAASGSRESDSGDD